jgi:uncharacterized protein (TIGR00288 family)
VRIVVRQRTGSLRDWADPAPDRGPDHFFALPVVDDVGVISLPEAAEELVHSDTDPERDAVIVGAMPAFARAAMANDTGPDSRATEALPNPRSHPCGARGPRAHDARTLRYDRKYMNSRHPRPPRAPVAPLHRGPQAMPIPSALTAAAVHHAPNAALLIDFDNVTMGIRSDLQTELRNLLSSDIVKGKVAVQRAYADWRRYPQYIVPLSESSIDLIFAPAYGSSKKNATDIRLAIDAIELVFTRPEIGTIILLSGDSDFSSLVIKLKEYGKYVIGVGIRESSSDLLVQNCDEYYSYNALAGLVKTGEEEMVKYDPWELVTEAINRMVANRDVMRSDRLKQVMQEIDSSFDEKNLGISKFSRFCTEAAQRGLLLVTKLENGQLEVAPPHARITGPATPAAAAAADAARIEGPPPVSEQAREEAAREERGRRGRRGGRGRGRDREERGRLPIGEAGAPSAAVAVIPPASQGDIFAGPSVPPQPEAQALAAAPSAPPTAADTIGVGGERLTRDEAFDLVRRAVETLTSGDRGVPASAVRSKAHALLGRDSESLSERNFTRILKDAHDADRIDLRRRGDDYEVALAAETAPVAEQLNRAAAAAQHAARPVETPVVPRGMGPRGAGPRGRGPAARAVAPPPDLLLVGVVDDSEPVLAVAEPVRTPSAVETEVAESAPAKRAKPRGRVPAKKAAKPAAAVESGGPAAKPAAKAKRPRGKKPAASGGGKG